jgi:uncharacterized protein YbbK (DUF523 family)
MKVCSACLLGIECRYDGRSKPNEKVLELSKQEVLIPICPEQLGGLPTPRTASEIQGGFGEEVINGKSYVKTLNGENVTEQYIRGAEISLNIAKMYNIKEAILKQKSPSCGCGKSFDGTFTDTLIDGDGVTTALFKKHGLEVITEEDL